MSDPGEPFAMWDSGAYDFLMPMTSLPKTATGTSRAMGRLAVGDAQAVYWNDEVFCKEYRTPLVPATKVIQSLGLIQYTSGRRGAL
eukprot:12922504-Prorocentrum_lima.AAC.1